MICRRTSSLAPAFFTLGTNTVSVFCVPHVRTECSCARAMSARSMGYRLCHRLPPLRAAVRCRTDGARRFLHEDLLQSTEIAIVEQPTDHALWNLAPALRIELMAGREYEPIIEPVDNCCHAGADERRSLEHRGTGETAVRMTIVQQK